MRKLAIYLAAAALLLCAEIALFDLLGIPLYRRAKLLDGAALSVVAAFFLLTQAGVFRGVLSFVLLAGGLIFVSTYRYYLLDAPLRIDDLLMLREAAAAAPRPAVILLVAALVVGMLLYVINLERTRRSAAGLGAAVSVLVVVPFIVDAEALQSAITQKRFFHPWDSYHPRQHGTFASLLGQELLKRVVPIPPASGKRLLRPLVPALRRNVYVMVMESLSDPLEWRQSLKSDPIDPRLRSSLGGTAYPSILGGASVESEFELLCGTSTGFVEGGLTFTALGGTPIDCLPTRLRRSGYKALAFCATGEKFNNAGNAYRSLGFSEIYLQDSFPKAPLDSGWASTNTYLSLLKPMITRELAAGSPLFVYVFFTSGHAPYVLAPEHDPQLELVEGNRQLNDYLNAVYLNTRLVADFLVWLQERDPTALILLTGDHQPTISASLRGIDADPALPHTDPERVAALYPVPYLLLDAGRALRPGAVTHYRLSTMLAEILAGETPSPTAAIPRPLRSGIFYLSQGELRRCSDAVGGCGAVLSELGRERQRYFRLLADSRRTLE